jgi:putative ABC transport system permease protein
MNGELRRGARTGRQASVVSPAAALRETCRMALKDLYHDRRTMFVFVLTVAAIVAPLLLLLGLKDGFVANLRDTLLRDPRNLEVVVYGSAKLPQEWFSIMAARDDVAFVVPKTRTINASIDLLDARRRLHQAVEIVPTGPADPLLPEGLSAPIVPTQVLASATLAEKLALEGAAVGGREPASESIVVAVIKRERNGRREHARLPLAVVGIVPERNFARDALFTHPALLVASEDYRDGLSDLADTTAVSDENLRRRTTFANARIYARELDAVAGLAAHMRAQGIEVRTQAERIASVQALDRVLSFLFRVIAAIGAAGCALALGGALWINAERKRHATAMLRLFGFGRLSVAALPVIQALAIGLGGLLFALVLFRIGASVFESVLGENLGDDAYATRLAPTDALIAAGSVLLIAALSAGAAAWRAARIPPAEGLRDL